MSSDSCACVDSQAGLENKQSFGPVVRPKRTDTTWIYFYEVKPEKYIKIGHSRKPRGVRQKQHERSGIDPIELELLCEVRGVPSDEAFVHRYFRGFTGPKPEVFHPSIELKEYVNWLRQKIFVCTPMTTDTERELLPCVDSEQWCPAPERRLPIARFLPGFAGGPFGLGVPEPTGDDYYTCPEIIEIAREVMGGIDTDPASHPVANKVVKASRFFTIEDNGLAQRWNGRVWVNPPFSTWADWVPKIIAEWKSGDVSECCVLVASRTITAKYFAPMLRECVATCVINGRFAFWGPKAAAPDDGHLILYFGPNVNKFSACFGRLGTVFSPVRAA